jgi:hypothetical protein
MHQASDRPYAPLEYPMKAIFEQQKTGVKITVIFMHVKQNNCAETRGRTSHMPPERVFDWKIIR